MKVSNSPFLTAKRPLLEELIDALKNEYEYCSVLAMDNYGKSYRISASGISVGDDAFCCSRGFVVRAMNRNAYAEYSFNELSEDSIPEILSRIKEELLPLEEVFPDGVSMLQHSIPEEEPTVFVGATEYQIHPKELSEDEILAKLSDIRSDAMSCSDKLVDAIVGCNWQEIHKIFLSPNKNLEQNLLWTNAMYVCLAMRGQEMKDCYAPFSVLGGMELLDKVKEKVGDSVETVLSLLDSEHMIPGEYDCICTPPVTGMIVHEAFGHGVEMDMFAKDRALAKSCIGDQVASELVTMHDGAIGAEECGSYFFDDEGTMAHDTIVIENGILKRGISDLLSAQTLGTEPTGNGRRENYEHKTYARMTNTYFLGGNDSVEDMIASIDYGFLLDCPTSGMEDPKNWGIQAMVGFAKEIRNGSFTGKVFSPVILTGYTPDLLKSITMMSPRVEICGSGMCGKGYKEMVKVSDGGPYIKARVRLG